AVLEFGLRGARLLCPAEERHWLPWEARDNEWTLYQYDSAARLEEPAGRLRLVLDAGLADARRDQLAGAARRRAWPPRTATVRGTGCIRGGGWRLPDWGGARRARGRGGALLRPHELGAVVPRPPRPRYHAPRRNATTGKVRSMIFKSSTTHRRAMYSRSKATLRCTSSIERSYCWLT